MTPNEARSDISRLATELLKADLAAAVNAPTIQVDGDISRITWPAASAASGLLSSLPFASIFEYRTLLLGSHFICLMNDGALLQLSVDIRNNQTVGHRFAYYPCPVMLPASIDVLDSDELDIILLQELDSAISSISDNTNPTGVQLRLRSPIRFDYDASPSSDPPSHFHFANPDVRVPVHSALSVGHFVQFVMRHFYPEAWANTALHGVTHWPIRQQTRCIRPDDLLQLHLDRQYSDTIGPVRGR
jgi:hypothetical protein